MTLTPRSIVACAALVASTCALVPSMAQTAANQPRQTVVPEPDPVPRRWQLDFTPGALRTVTLTMADGSVRSFAYMTYKVVNNTGQDLLFAPSLEMSTDEGSLIRAGRDVPAEATRRILDSLQNPFLQDQISVVGPLLQGEENAREGLAVWLLPDVSVAELTVYIAGLSGETRAIETKDAKTGETSRTLLRKTMMIKYFGPGEVEPASGNEILRSEDRWILR